MHGGPWLVSFGRGWEGGRQAGGGGTQRLRACILPYAPRVRYIWYAWSRPLRGWGMWQQKRSKAMQMGRKCSKQCANTCPDTRRNQTSPCAPLHALPLAYLDACV